MTHTNTTKVTNQGQHSHSTVHTFTHSSSPFLKQSFHFPHTLHSLPQKKLLLNPLMFLSLFVLCKHMAFLNTLFTTLLSFSLLLLLITPPFSLSSSPPSPSSSIHDLLRSKGLPAGLLPEEVKSYTFSEDGHLEVFLDAPCLTKYETRVFFERVVTANLTYGSLIGVEGLQQEELFVWLPVKDIIVDDPSSGLILFDIGLAYKQLSLSLFEDPPHCKPQGGVSLRNHVRKEKGFEALR